MKTATVARNYAEALLAVAEAGRAMEAYAGLIEAVAGAIRADRRIAVVLDSPRIPKPVKAQLLESALDKLAPREFVRFLQAVVRRGRQGLFSEIADEYQALVDVKLDRVHAGITLADQPDARMREQVIQRLSTVFGKAVRAHFRADAGILGGIIVRVGDRVYDGSLKRRLNVLRRRMLLGE